MVRPLTPGKSVHPWRWSFRDKPRKIAKNYEIPKSKQLYKLYLVKNKRLTIISYLVVLYLCFNFALNSVFLSYMLNFNINVAPPPKKKDLVSNKFLGVSRKIFFGATRIKGFARKSTPSKFLFRPWIHFKYKSKKYGLISFNSKTLCLKKYVY